MPRPESTTDDNTTANSTEPIIDFRFTGHRGALFRLVLKNAFLTILTAGIYRFWAKTWVRQFFWHNIRIKGDALEYTGTPAELFIGFLIVLTVLIPIFAIYEGASFLLLSAPEWAEIALEVAYVVALLGFFQVARFRMWRYRLNRTTWRGIRFGLHGSTWNYLWLSIGWMLVTFFTAGLAFPYFRIATWRYRIRNMRFGSTAFEFTGNARNLMIPWLIAYALPAMVIASLGWLHFDTFADVWSKSDSAEEAVLRLPFADSKVAWVLAVFPFLFVWYRVCESRQFLSGIGWTNVRLKSHLQTAAVLIAAIITLVLWTCFVSAVGAGIWILSKYVHENTLGLIVIASFFLIFVFTPVVTYSIMRYEIVGHVCRTLGISNAAAFELATNETNQGPEFGEGLADALDVGAV